MNRNQVQVRELAGWELDTYEFRPKHIDQSKLDQSALAVQQRPVFQQSNVVLMQATEKLRDVLSTYLERPDLLLEMSGLSWSLGIVDLRPLIAFQRRLSFDPNVHQRSIPAARDWPALLSLSFGEAKSLVCEVLHEASMRTMILRSGNPNMHFRMTHDVAFPLNIHPGGPFLEVARLRDRWFLRDGYHRAYNLLRQGIFEVPAVIIEATTVEELGATQPWFFSEQVIFSKTPPRVVDFLNDEMVLEYNRPQLIKTLRITMEETLASASHTGEPS